MIGNLVLDAELAKPPVGQIDLHLGAEPPLRAEREHVAHNQHPDHQHRIDRGTARVRVVGRKLLVHPTKIENAVDLAHQMIGWHHLVEIKRIKELALSAFPPTHHEPLPLMPSQSNGITVRESSQWVFCNTILRKADSHRTSREVGGVPKPEVATPDTLDVALPMPKCPNQGDVARK